MDSPSPPPPSTPRASDANDPPPADASKPAPAPPTLTGSIQATLFVLVVLTVIGTVLAFISALIVVKIGIGGPRFFVGLPILVVGRIAWALSAHRSGQRDVLVHGTSAIVGVALAAALIFGAKLPAPSTMLHHSSEVVDAKIHGDSVALTFESKTELQTMPPFGLLVEEVAAYACLAVALGAVVRLARRGRDDDASPDLSR
jgi:hypothetical protein